MPRPPAPQVRTVSKGPSTALIGGVVLLVVVLVAALVWAATRDAGGLDSQGTGSTLPEGGGVSMGPGTDADVTQIRVGESALDCATGTYEALSSPKAFTLTGTSDGTKTIFACLKEAAGRTLQVSDTIVLDQTRPTLTSVSIEGGAAAVRTTSVTITLVGASADTTQMAVADAATLERISAAWRTWAADPDAWILLPHGEIIATG